MVDKNLKQEACQLYIEQQIEDGLEHGKTAYRIGKDLTKEIEHLFEAKVKPNTIMKRAQRIRKRPFKSRDKIGTNSNVLKDTPGLDKVLARATEIGKEIGLENIDTLHMALDLFTHKQQ